MRPLLWSIVFLTAGSPAQVDVRGRVLQDGGAAASTELMYQLVRTTPGGRYENLRVLLPTDAEGRFAFTLDAWPVGAPPVLIVCDTARRRGARLIVSGSADVGDVKLGEAPLLVSGRVRVGAAGGGLLPPRVRVEEPDDHALGSAPPWREVCTVEADRDGRFAVRAWTGATRLRAVAVGGPIDAGPVREFAPGAADVELVLAAPGRIAGRVAGLADLGTGTLAVSCRPQGIHGGLEAVVQADGTFTVERLAPGRYDLEVQGRITGEVMARVEGVEVVAGQASADQRLTPIALLLAARILRFHVTDAAGADLDADYVVYVRAAGGGDYRGAWQNRARFEVATASPALDVALAGIGYRDVRIDGVDSDREVVLARGIPVRVACGAGAAAVGAGLRIRVSLRPQTPGPVPSAGDRSAAVGADATALLFAAAPGPHELVAWVERTDGTGIHLGDGFELAVVAHRPVVVQDTTETLEVRLEPDADVIRRASARRER